MMGAKPCHANTRGVEVIHSCNVSVPVQIREEGISRGGPSEVRQRERERERERIAGRQAEAEAEAGKEGSF